METNRKEHVIEGTVFLVDVDTLALIEKANPANAIAYQYMDYKGSHYEMAYDKVRKNAAYLGSKELDTLHVTVPLFAQLDPSGMAQRFGLTLNDMAGKTDFDLLVGEEAFIQRQAGVLPAIKIGDDIFTIDMRLGEIRHNSGMFPPIRLSHMDVSGDGEHFEFLYDQANKELYTPDYSMLRIPDHVFLATIPNEVSLDPYGIARQFGIEEKTFMFHHPPPKELATVLTPAKDTWLAKLVATNRDDFNKGKNNAIDGHSKKQGL